VKEFAVLGDLMPGFNTTFRFEDYLWARAVLSSRVFGWKLAGFESEEFLIPFGDMLNHRSPKQVEWRYSTDAEGVEYIARENISAGDEIFISYGAKDNARYLLHYGFTVEAPASRVVRLHVPLSEDLPLVEEKRTFLRKALMLKDPEAEPDPTFDLKDSWSLDADDVLAYLRLLNADDGNDLERRLKSGACSRFSMVPKCKSSISLRNEEAVLRHFHKLVTDALALYAKHEARTLDAQRLLRDERAVLEWWAETLRLLLEELAAADVEAFLDEHFPRHHSAWTYAAIKLQSLITANVTG
jgi:histone-lysine N-methyltransferase SETD3